VPTIQDVARAAGVSTSTVSHVLNETRPVNADTRQRVLDAMAALDYRPNRLARSLRNRRTNTLGVLLPNSANPFFAQILLGIEAACFEHDYNVILGNANDDARREMAYLDVLVSKQVDGILLVSTGAYRKALDLLAPRGVPVVMVDRSPAEVYEGWQIDAVYTDNEEGGRQATDYLIQSGHRRIACIGGPALLTSGAGRVIGYRLALERAHLPVDETLILEGDFEHEGGYQAGKALLNLPEPPTAIFACNDLMAVGVLYAASEAGVRVPDELSVIGFDDIPLASYTVPRLTTVTQQASLLGRAGVDLMLARLKERSRPTQHRCLPVTLTERASCGPPRG
jgi:LacI family transcriptional regulator